MKYTLMNMPMTIAIQDDRKTNTRRCIKNTKYADFSSMKIDEKVYPKGRLIHYKYMGKNCSMFSDDFIKQYAKYQIGETIWVREPVKVKQFNIIKIDFEYLADGKIVNDFQYPAKFYGRKWIENCQGIPNGCIKEMARIFLKITDIRVERLQDISEEDIKKEGWSDKMALEDYADIYKEYGAISVQRAWWIKLWDNTAPKGYKWEDNPYVFVYEFEKVEV